jgi:hypothetical protein
MVGTVVGLVVRSSAYGGSVVRCEKGTEHRAEGIEQGAGSQQTADSPQHAAIILYRGYLFSASCQLSAYLQLWGQLEAGHDRLSRLINYVV